MPQSNLKHIPLASTVPGWTETGGAYHPPVTTYTSKTQIDFTASIQAVDLATGRIHSQQRIAVSPSRQVSSTLGAPEFPSDTEVRELAVGMARDQVRRMLLPWTEKRKLIFYDDRNYGMKDAYKRLRLDDAQGALQKSMEALAAAKADPQVRPKFLGHASYNVGMCHLILGNYQEALPFLKAARETDPKHKIYAGAETECLGAIKLQAELSRVEANSAKVLLDPAPAEPAWVEPPRAAEHQPKAAPPVEERLEQLERLRQKGLLTPEEYGRKRAEIMQQL